MRERGTTAGRAAAVLAAIAAVALVAAGVGSGSTTRGGGSASTLVVGSTTGIPQLNPAIRTFVWEETLFPLLWDGLTQYTPTGAAAADLATSWKSSANAKTWTFTLRSGVHFSNGVAVTPKDVVKTFRYYLNPQTVTQERNKIQIIKSVTAVGANQVRFALSQANAQFPVSIVYVKILDMAALGQIDTNPIGTGPYVVKSFVPNSTVTLVPNTHYWGAKPKLSSIQIVTESDPTSALNALKAGDIDVFWGVPDQSVPTVRSSNLKLVVPKTPSQWLSWEVDTTSPPFNNVKARQALAYAINRPSVLQSAWYGDGKLNLYNDPLSTNNPFFNAAGQTKYSYDLAKAKQLFAEAGVGPGSTLTWWSVTGVPSYQTAGELLQASLKQIGITLNIVNNDGSTWAAKFYPAGKSYPGLIVPNLQSTPANPAYSMNFLLSGRCECNWKDAQYQKLYYRALAAPPAKAKALWDKLQQIANQQVPVMVPFQSTLVTAVRSNVQGVWEEGGSELRLESASKSG